MCAQAQQETPNAPTPQQSPVSTTTSSPGAISIRTPSNLAIPHSNDPVHAYAPSPVPKPDLSNSPRLEQLIRDGKLYISLQDAIDLALENNLDLAIARYNLPIADTDIQRTKAGGFFRGVNTGVVQGTVGGGVGGFGTGAPGAGAGGTTGGAGGAGAGASGLVQSTLGIGTNVSSYDPILSGTTSLEHQTLPLSNITLYGVPSLQTNIGLVNLNYSQAFPTGTSFSLEVDNNRQTSNSIFNSLNPTLNSFYRFTIQQQLLAGFGTGPNLRYLRIARNNKKISDIAFKSQVISTVTQIADMYWDLVSAYQGEKVMEQSDAFAQQSLDTRQEAASAGSHPGDGCAARRGRGLEARPGPDCGQDHASAAGIAGEERAHQESRRSHAGSDAGDSHRHAGDGAGNSRAADAGSDHGGACGPAGSCRSRTSI